jgi:ubiquinone/menaquinone biosynthesis C-methylase UbiE
MTAASDDSTFDAGIPALYERHFVPVIFAPYATALVDRLEALGAARILELAAGTGALTREMAARLPPSVSITATDLNQPMLDHAASVGTPRPVEWRQADALDLPFASGTFDAVTCQFGAMFFPDKVRAFAEARRVLAPGGSFLFAVWDTVETNEFCDTVMRALDARFGAGTIAFMRRAPHAYFDAATIRRDLGDAEFTRVRIDVVQRTSVGESAASVAIGFCQGNPMRLEMEQLGAGVVEEATKVAEQALRARYGDGPIEGRIQALVIEATAG